MHSLGEIIESLIYCGLIRGLGETQVKVREYSENEVAASLRAACVRQGLPLFPLPVKVIF